MSTYLLKKHQRWWYNRGIPKHLQAAFGKTKFQINLHTSDQKIALSRKPMAEVQFNLAIDKAQRRLNGTLAPLEQVEDVAKAFREANSFIDEDGDLFLDADPDEIRKAERQIQAPLQDYFADVVMGRAPKSLRTFVDEYLASVSHLAPRTLLERKTALERLVAWCSANGTVNVLKFTRINAKAFTASLQGEAPTIIKALQAPTALWRFIEEDGVAVNPAIWKNLAPKKSRREKNEDQERPFALEELQKLLSAPSSSTLRDSMLLSLYTGMRLSEIGDLRVEHVDIVKETIHVPGTKSATALRIIPIHPRLSELLKSRTSGKSPRDYILHELDGDGLKHGRKRSAKLSQAFTRYREGLGVTDERDNKRRSLVNFHSFRRTCTKAMMEHSVSSDVINAFFGWSTQGSMRHRYAVNADLMRAMREALSALNWGL